MCTALTFNNKDFYFGRNLDLDWSFSEQVVITPRNYKFDLKNKTIIHTKYAIIGMATVVDTYPLYAEGANEVGLCIAGLNYPGNALYFEPNENKNNIAPFELIPYILGLFKSVKEVKEIVKDLNITNLTYREGFPLSSLHWIISDKDESIVLEQNKTGLHVYDNPVGVLTNNPSFDYHLENIKNYMHLSNLPTENRMFNNLDLKQYCEGMGLIGLPGDYSSASRFIKASFMKFNAQCDEDENSNVNLFIRILDSVSMIKGSVKGVSGRYDVTFYSCCINATKGLYYYKTYDNPRISCINMHNVDLNGNSLVTYELNRKLDINYQN